MKLYNLNSKLDFGEYKGKSLSDVFKKDPEYIEECVFEEAGFCFNPSIVDALEDLHPDFAFSEEAVEKLENKFDIYEEEEENSYDELENFSDADLKNLGIMDDLDDDDDYGDSGGFYDYGYGY